ncbi:glycogen/starch/alpha-glucan phosphorylase [Oceanidesulfovibrio marinus]|uniref:Alpha-1,4 glucan phosphorylase n=1 Tax=Oceanidesulfovibrio marinus TaxID=370038 RepID=A0A6P1ZKK9_9BACT|nr:glycogen/starch/alpha-glucan phosphorylase [Oceanidesulfovibrio marinus]QJT09091.1 glycogen/starch/alpha-glucan phosphorylase [Oceanidesulfovibrio marinus]TVM36481.1 glycogen phosphorylase [Oceanidesulfovibrio marinus]
MSEWKQRVDLPIHPDISAESFQWRYCPPSEDDPEALKADVIRHIVSTLGSDYARKNHYNYYYGLALALRDRLVEQWLTTQRSYYDEETKRVYYLSLEYLPGKSLVNNLICLGLYHAAYRAMADFGLNLEELTEVEWDAGLGNGGLGRLASCYLDSMATLGVPGYGYGIRYDYGMFNQVIENGAQVEKADNWMRTFNPWEFDRGINLVEVKFGGRVKRWVDEKGRMRNEWIPENRVRAMPCDTLVPGYRNRRTINMRLWSARSDREFDLSYFNTGDYVGAVEEKVRDENISKVLYPSEDVIQGKELRLKQQYFFVAASLHDIVRRFKKKNDDFKDFPDKVAIQLNDTHPAVAIPELMRLLVDVELVDWDTAWSVCEKTFAYTNHTILPEALETWPVELFGQVLPRHLEIIYEINRRFLETVEAKYANLSRAELDERKQRLSLIGEGKQKHVRMANLAIVGSHSVNGVAALHTQILKDSVFKDFHELYPDKINNKTNGVTPRRWLRQSNPRLTGLIGETLNSEAFLRDLDLIKEIEPYADDSEFRKRWADVKRANKAHLRDYLERQMGVSINLDSVFDVQVKRIHEYKRQLLNVLHVVTLFNRIIDNPNIDVTPRTVLFGGKAAPGYFMAKRIIRLINAVADVVNSEPRVAGKLEVHFMPNYRVSQAEVVIPATELSEQISMAGMEASGTGNMKFAINGALTIGTLDGATIEMAERIGKENMFLFGNTADEIVTLKREGYNPWAYYEKDLELKRTLDMIAGDFFSRNDPGLFQPLVDSLLSGGDRYCLLADYRSYIETQEQVTTLYRDQDEWTRRSILNTARMGFFSSDRSIAEYARNIWGLQVL